MRDERSGWIRLSTAEFFLLWTGCGLGDPPTVFGLRRIGRTGAARAAVAETASESLAERGLGTVHRPAADLAGLLDALAGHRRSMDLVTQPDGFRALAVDAADATVAAAVSGEELRLGPVRRGALVGSLLDALPAVQAGPGRTANIGWAEYQRACAKATSGGTQAFLDELRSLGLHQPEAHTLLRALTERRAGGQFGASLRDGHGRPQRVGETVSWVDTPAGRYAMRVRDGWLTVTPADLVKLGEMAGQLIQFGT